MKIKLKISQHLKNWHQKQQEFYNKGESKPNSESRSKAAEFIRSKVNGIAKSVMHEVHEFKHAGSALKKFFTGNLKDINHHEKDALKTIAIHTGIVIGTMALTGGLGHLLHGGVLGAAGGIGVHYLEHSAITRIGHALLFAKGEEDYLNMSDEDLLKKFIISISNHMESGNIKEEDWKNKIFVQPK